MLWISLLFIEDLSLGGTVRGRNQYGGLEIFRGGTKNPGEHHVLWIPHDWYVYEIYTHSFKKQNENQIKILIYGSERKSKKKFKKINVIGSSPSEMNFHDFLSFFSFQEIFLWLFLNIWYNLCCLEFFCTNIKEFFNLRIESVKQEIRELLCNKINGSHFAKILGTCITIP